MVVTIMGKFSPNSKVGIIVLADENMKEYTAISIQSSGKHRYISYTVVFGWLIYLKASAFMKLHNFYVSINVIPDYHRYAMEWGK